MPTLFVIMGPSGCGKSTVGQALAKRMGVTFIEGDEHHPLANLQKMAEGHPLSDTDRREWLDRIVNSVRAESGSIVLACSALTQYVQQRLADECHKTIKYCLLELDKSVLERRVSQRTGHFMPAKLVASQMAALVVPPGALRLAGDRRVSTIVKEIIAASSDRRE